MEITHEEARRLVQFDADQALNASSQSVLSAHLEVCSACRRYAHEIKEIESLLPPVMKQHWDIALPHSHSGRTRKQDSRRMAVILLAIRTTVVSLVFAAFVLGLQSLMLPESGSNLPMAIAPAPTPSAVSTTTRAIPENCTVLVYNVLAGDTLERLAAHFVVPKEELIEHNGLITERLMVGMKLKIPLCHYTPTGTVIATTFTQTEIPLASRIPSTTGPEQ